MDIIVHCEERMNGTQICFNTAYLTFSQRALKLYRDIQRDHDHLIVTNTTNIYDYYYKRLVYLETIGRCCRSHWLLLETIFRLPMIKSQVGQTHTSQTH